MDLPWRRNESRLVPLKTVIIETSTSKPPTPHPIVNDPSSACKQGFNESGDHVLENLTCSGSTWSGSTRSDSTRSDSTRSSLSSSSTPSSYTSSSSSASSVSADTLGYMSNFGKQFDTLVISPRTKCTQMLDEMLHQNTALRREYEVFSAQLNNDISDDSQNEEQGQGTLSVTTTESTTTEDSTHSERTASSDSKKAKDEDCFSNEMEVVVVEDSEQNRKMLEGSMLTVQTARTVSDLSTFQQPCKLDHLFTEQKRMERELQKVVEKLEQKLSKKKRKKKRRESTQFKYSMSIDDLTFLCEVDIE